MPADEDRDIGGKVIGLVQRPYMDIAFDPVQLGLMRGLKKVFDPLGIMNPGKVLP